jgi:putative transposase
MLKYHLIWTPRRRRSVLVGEVAARLSDLLHEKSRDLDARINYLHVEPDYLHLLVDAPPDLAVTQLVYRLKDYSAHALRAEFPDLHKMPSLWTTFYFATTLDEVSPEQIQEYLEAQSKRD